jgi:nucleotide-binding universal stress UspA family protein
MQMREILWASDGSKESRTALRWGELLAKQLGSKITAFTAVESPNLSNLAVSAEIRGRLSAVETKTRQRETRRLDRIKETLARRGLNVETEIATGLPHEAIVKAIQSRSVDLVVMGTRGFSAWARMLLGSTAVKVLREAHAPILTTHQSARKPNVKEILVPTDFAPNDAAALDWATELAAEFGATVTLLHVFEAHQSWDSVKGGSMGRLRDAATKQLQSIIAAIPNDKRKAISIKEQVKVFPRPWSGIVDFARKGKCDIIVMSTHGRSGVPRYFLGSAAESVIKNAPCPVIAVRR